MTPRPSRRLFSYLSFVILPACGPDHPGAVHTGGPDGTPSAAQRLTQVPCGALRLEEEVPVFPAPTTAGHNDSQPGLNRLWIMKVMSFTVDGLGNLQLSQDGMRLEGVSDFILPLYVNEIQSRWDSPLVLRSNRNVTVNSRNAQGQLTGQLTVGQEAVEAQCRSFQVRSADGEKVLFSADEDEIRVGTDNFRVTGPEGVVFGHSVETPLIRAEGAQDLKLESPTRTVTMDAPKGVEVSAAGGELKATCRKDLELQSTEGEIFLDANTIRLGSLLPLGVYSPSSDPGPQRQTVYELCVCPNGKMYLSPAHSSSTCQSMSNVCLWS
ncbi:hypothetical protein UPYG_G00242990 [Umbra pygmaea]|uniref:Zeta-sarcoglycan n=1 Tax=Umbra pygmaea TaxID=75934 RepID=A0ABD0WZX2_UMBPY